jgi:hypothetical protein
MVRLHVRFLGEICPTERTLRTCLSCKQNIVHLSSAILEYSREQSRHWSRPVWTPLRYSLVRERSLSARADRFWQYVKFQVVDRKVSKLKNSKNSSSGRAFSRHIDVNVELQNFACNRICHQCNPNLKLATSGKSRELMSHVWTRRRAVNTKLSQVSVICRPTSRESLYRVNTTESSLSRRAISLAQVSLTCKRTITDCTRSYQGSMLLARVFLSFSIELLNRTHNHKNIMYFIVVNYFQGPELLYFSLWFSKMNCFSVWFRFSFQQKCW